jgi:acyl-lipid omega-6 desaturase (Delta-12 desaturase)
MNNETITAKEKYRMALNVLKPFCKKNIPLAVFQGVFTFLAIVSLSIVSYFLYEKSSWFSVLLMPAITAFLCRSYVIEHDCGHQSFFRTKFANAFLGNIFGFMNLIPYEMWRYIHNSHHNHVGNLDKRTKLQAKRSNLCTE